MDIIINICKMSSYIFQREYFKYKCMLSKAMSLLLFLIKIKIFILQHLINYTKLCKIAVT